MAILGNCRGMEKVIKKSGDYIKEPEVPEGTTITRKELSRRTKEIMGNPNSRKYDHCRICLARWGMPC